MAAYGIAQQVLALDPGEAPLSRRLNVPMGPTPELRVATMRLKLVRLPYGMLRLGAVALSTVRALAIVALELRVLAL